MMYHINVYRRGRVVPHVVIRAETTEGSQVVEAVARQQGYVTKVAMTTSDATPFLERMVETMGAPGYDSAALSNGR